MAWIYSFSECNFFYMIVTDILKYSNQLQVAKNFRKRADYFHSGKSHISLKFWKHSSIFWKFHLQITQGHLILSHTVSGSFCQTNMCKIELWTSHVQEPQAHSWVNLPSDDFLSQFNLLENIAEKWQVILLYLLSVLFWWKKWTILKERNFFYNIEWYNMLVLQN